HQLAREVVADLVVAARAGGGEEVERLLRALLGALAGRVAGRRPEAAGRAAEGARTSPRREARGQVAHERRPLFFEGDGDLGARVRAAHGAAPLEDVEGGPVLLLRGLLAVLGAHDAAPAVAAVAVLPLARLLEGGERLVVFLRAEEAVVVARV